MTLSKSNRAALVSSSMVRSSFCRRRERKLRSRTRKSVLIVVRQLHGKKAINTSHITKVDTAGQPLHFDVCLNCIRLWLSFKKNIHPTYEAASQSGAALENQLVCPSCQMKTGNLSSPGVALVWTGSAAARQWQIFAPATCGWSPCRLPGTLRRC